MKRLSKKTHQSLRKVRHAKVRGSVKGVADCPRLSVFRGLRSIVAQLIDDKKGVTICCADSKEIKKSKIEGRSAKVAIGYAVGKLLAEKAKVKGIVKVVFDRGGYCYHGRVKAVAEGAREGGLVF